MSVLYMISNVILLFPLVSFSVNLTLKPLSESDVVKLKSV